MSEWMRLNENNTNKRKKIHFLERKMLNRCVEQKKRVLFRQGVKERACVRMNEWKAGWKKLDKKSEGRRRWRREQTLTIINHRASCVVTCTIRLNTFVVCVCVCACLHIFLCAFWIEAILLFVYTHICRVLQWNCIFRTGKFMARPGQTDSHTFVHQINFIKITSFPVNQPTNQPSIPRWWFI